MNEAFRLPDQEAVAAPVKRKRTVLYVVIAAMTAMLILGIGTSLRLRVTVAKSETGPAPALMVTAASSTRAVWPMTLEASGPIAAWQEASIGAEVGGYKLVEVLVNVGDQVVKGQVLARFDPALLQADEARLSANDEEAKANEQRSLRLQKLGAVSDQDTLRSVTQSKTAGALLASNRLQLRYADVAAPDDGVISARTATLGAVVPSGQELFRLIRQNRIEWHGEFTASQLARVEIGQRIELVLPNGKSATATVRQIAPSLDPQTRMGTVYADIASGSEARAGMYVDGRLTIGESVALFIPAECVTIRDGRSFVLKIMDAGETAHVSLRQVLVGRRQGDQIEILRGVDPEDRLVGAGAGFLDDGDLVRVTAIGERGGAGQSP